MWIPPTAHKLNRLTVRQVEAAKFDGKPRKLFDGGGLFLHIQESGKYWRMKYRHGGKEKLLALGVASNISLSDARERRTQASKLLAKGIDPMAHKRELAASSNAKTDTFEAIAREWLALQSKKLAPDTLRLARRRLENHAFPYIGNAAITEIEPPDILRVLRRLEGKGQHETAHRLRQRIGQVFRYGIATGNASRDPTGDLQGALAPVTATHRAALTEPKAVGALLVALDGYRGQPATLAALQLLPLTFVRPGELRRATWPEFDLDEAMWRIPAERMKMRREHLVPLSRQAVEALRNLYPLTGHRPFVFESVRPHRPMSDNTINSALRTLGYAGDVMTAHGFRAMASTLLHEMGWPPEVIELQLAHAQRNQVAAAYNRSARLADRKKMMQRWADYLDQLRVQASAPNIISGKFGVGFKE